MARLFQVIVCGFKGERLHVDLCNTEEQFRRLTVLDLKRKILQKLPSNIDLDDLSLVFVDEWLDDDSKLLSDLGIQHLSVVLIIIRVDCGGYGPEEREEEKESGNMGDKDRKNISMDRLDDFNRSSCIVL